MIELYHGEPNMFSLKPLIALHEKQLPFTSHYLDLEGLERLQWERFEVQYNPEGEGPVLIDRDAPMTESAFILLYLEDAYPDKPLRGSDPESRWRILAWARFLNEVTAPAVSTLGCHKFLAPQLEKRDRSKMERAVAKLASKEQQQAWRAAIDNNYSEDLLADCRRKLELSVKKIEAALQGNAWLAGADFSVADIDAFALLRPIAKNFPEFLEEAPRTSAWLERIEARPAVQAALAMSKTGKPETSFTPGPEHSRWG